jgi:hypothetical protein
MRLSKKRLLIAAGGITAVGAATTLVAGVTFGLFSAKLAQSPSNTFAAGTVTLAQTASTSCTIGQAPSEPMEAGDASTGFSTPGTDPPCTFSVNYSGSLGAFIGLGLVASPLPTGGLYDGTATGLQFQISDGTHSYTTGGAINTNSSTSPLYVSTDATPASHTFTVNYGLPLGATNAYQGLSTTLTITVYAVQDSNNGSAAACTAGTACAGITSWS